MPGSTLPISQLDWLISTTAMIVLSWSRATRDLLKSFGWGIRALHQLGCSDDGAISSSPAPYHLAAGAADGEDRHNLWLWLALDGLTRSPRGLRLACRAVGGQNHETDVVSLDALYRVA